MLERWEPRPLARAGCRVNMHGHAEQRPPIHSPALGTKNYAPFGRACESVRFCGQPVHTINCTCERQSADVIRNIWPRIFLPVGAGVCEGLCPRLRLRAGDYYVRSRCLGRVLSGEREHWNLAASIAGVGQRSPRRCEHWRSVLGSGVKAHGRRDRSKMRAVTLCGEASRCRSRCEDYV